MADPTRTNLATGTSAVATTTATFGFTATANRLLVLVVAADDYKTGNPSGYTAPANTSIGGTGNIGGTSAFLGHYLWYKVAAGGETSVQYTIGSASNSCWAVLEFDSIDSASAFDVAPTATYTQAGATTYTSPTATPSTGRRFVVATIAGTSSVGNGLLTGVGTWTNSYTEQADIRTTPASGTGDEFGVATLAMDGTGAATTSTGATYEGSTAQSEASIVAVFKVASSGSNFTATQDDSTGLTDGIGAATVTPWVYSYSARQGG